MARSGTVLDASVSSELLKNIFFVKAPMHDGAVIVRQGRVLAAGCDTFVTSDLSYHQFLDAAAEGLNLLDAGHFPTENGVLSVLEAYLKGKYPALHLERSAIHRDVIRCWKADDPGGQG